MLDFKYRDSESVGYSCLSLQMLSKFEVDDRWAGLDRTDNSLPVSLKPAQRDTLFYILQGKHVLLNVPTGVLSNAGVPVKFCD